MGRTGLRPARGARKFFAVKSNLDHAVHLRRSNRTLARTWAAQELAPWRGQGLTSAGVTAAIDSAVAAHGSMFRYDVYGGQVTCRPKTPAEIGLEAEPAILGLVGKRAEAYRRLLQDSLPPGAAGRDFSLAVELSDLPPACPGLPFFAFQKRRGEPCLLLPDVDLLEFDFFDHRTWIDRLSYRRKRNQAIFVGSTTGETLTLEKVAALATPRLRAAQAFRDSSRVVFKLPNVVQCDTGETAAAVKALGFGEDFVSWREQLGYRHILSMDGNGATCSRVAIALLSRSTLLRYGSEYELFYFKGLKPWVHFIPIARDAEVEAIVADSAENPRRYARLAREGRRFFRRHLRRAPCRRYVAALLQGYVEMLDEG